MDVEWKLDPNRREPKVIILAGEITPELEELAPYALRELVKAIYIEAPDYSGGIRRQNIHICYDLVGFIPVGTLEKQETA